MSFNFPNSPTEGTAFSPSGGPQYIFSNGVWRDKGFFGRSKAFVGDIPPTDPAPVQGDLWWESDSGNLYVYYSDGDSSQWVQINTPTPKGPVLTADSYNRVVNGAFQHSQENGSTPSGTSGYYLADQWAGENSGFTGLSFLRAGGSGAYSAQISVGTARPSPAATDFLIVSQKIEGNRIAEAYWGTASAKPMALRFEVRTDNAGTYSVAIRNGGINRTWVGTFTLAAATWKTVTLAIPGDVTGTWAADASTGLQLIFCFASGTTPTAPALGWNAGNYLAAPGSTNAFAATGNSYVANVGLYLDPNNTGVAPPWVTPDFASELAASQRYFRVLTNGELLVSGYGPATAFAGYPLVPPMRTSPTHAFSGSPTYANASGLAINGIGAAFIRYAVTITAAGTGYGYSAASLNARM